MEEHFTDTSTYEMLAHDTTHILDNRLLSIAKDLFKRNYITKDIHKKITKHNSSISKAYGLSKIQKVDIPIRIIVASYESPCATWNISICCWNLEETSNKQ